MHRFIYVILFVAIAFASVSIAADYFPICNTPCQTGGHVPTCCWNHGYRAGFCRQGRSGNQIAFCVGRRSG